jgi:ABC-type sugar transport system permease subunit
MTERPGRWLIILPPLLFLLIFFLIPFAFAFKISFAETAARVPPFTDVLTRTPDNHLQCTSAWQLPVPVYRRRLRHCLPVFAQDRILSRR